MLLIVNRIDVPLAMHAASMTELTRHQANAPASGCLMEMHVRRKTKVYQLLNMRRLEEYLEAGKLSGESVITMKDLRDCGAVQRKMKDGVKLLGRVRLLGLENFP